MAYDLPGRIIGHRENQTAGGGLKTRHIKRQTMDPLLQRITFDQNTLAGKPVIRGLRISVEMILELLSQGATSEEIIEDYPELEPDDLRAALLYAHNRFD